jgi:hypothetical protein
MARKRNHRRDRHRRGWFAEPRRTLEDEETEPLLVAVVPG